MSTEINGFAQTMNDLINTFNELSAESTEIISALESLRSETDTVKTNYAGILLKTEKLRSSIRDLTAISRRDKQ